MNKFEKIVALLCTRMSFSELFLTTTFAGSLKCLILNLHIFSPECLVISGPLIRKSLSTCIFTPLFLSISRSVCICLYPDWLHVQKCLLLLQIDGRKGPDGWTYHVKEMGHEGNWNIVEYTAEFYVARRLHCVCLFMRQDYWFKADLSSYKPPPYLF